MRRPHLAIRARLAIVSALLAAGVLAAGLLTVYLIEAHQVHQALVADARAAAHDLALAGERPVAATGGPEAHRERDAGETPQAPPP